MILAFCITCWFYSFRIDYPRCFGSSHSEMLTNPPRILSNDITYRTLCTANSLFIEKFKDLVDLIHYLSHNQSFFSFCGQSISGHRFCDQPTSFQLETCYRYWRSTNCPQAKQTALILTLFHALRTALLSL